MAEKHRDAGGFVSGQYAAVAEDVEGIPNYAKEVRQKVFVDEQEYPVPEKSSLAPGILYAEGSRRYPEALSTYTRRRMTQAEKATASPSKFL